MLWPTMEQKLGSCSQVLGSYEASAVGGIAMSGDWEVEVMVVLMVVCRLCLWASHHCCFLGRCWLVSCQLCCVGLARMGEDPILWVVPEAGLLGGGDNLPVGTSTFHLMLCVSRCVGSGIGQFALQEFH